MKEKMNKIPVFYACDDNFVKYTMVSLQSMMDHASKEVQYEIHVLHTNISEEMQKKMYAMENANFSVQFDHVTEYLHSIQEKLPLRDYYSKTTYFRLFIAEMFPEIDKAIYIDSDTIVLGDIAQLYAYDLGDAYVGACREQVMIQEDVYGTYVEKVLGVERDNYFNAGMLVINCEQFRKNHVLEQFMELLPMYNFVVTQDEDYLNLICHNKVCWLPQKWNVEVFGQIPCREEEICVLHYIMVSKPWHYSDCRLQEYFWESAEKSSVYADGKWYNEVKGLSNVAGRKKQAISAVAVKVSKGNIKYRVHLLNGDWLPWVDGYDINDSNNGYAGIKGKVIDAIQVEFSGVGDYKATYRVRKQRAGFWDWQHNTEKDSSQDGYAGLFGNKIDGLQITLT